MKLVHVGLTGEIIREQDVMTELIIESPEICADYLQELYAQLNKKEGRFVLSQANKIIDIPKYVEIIMNPFDIEINNRKVINKLYGELEEISKMEWMYTKTLELESLIRNYLLELEHHTDYMLTFDEELGISTILKGVNMRYEEQEMNFFEKLVSYIKIIVKVLAVKLVVFVNIRSYLTDEQMQALCKEMTYQEVKGLFIENQERSCVEGVRRYIIDKDKCEIY